MSNVTLVRGLGRLAATAIVVGDVIGTGVFLKARVMTCNVGTPGLVMLVWVVGGLLSLAGALTYAELAVLMPQAGGEYVFIREAYGRLWGFLYGWTRFFVATTGGLAGLAFGFAIFLNIASGGFLGSLSVDFPLARGWHVTLFALPFVASAAILIVTLVNCAAVVVGGRIASVLAALKVTIVAGVGVGAFLLARGDWAHFAMTAAGRACEGVPLGAQGGFAGFGAAMLGAMWAYNGWNEVTYVAGEVKDPGRNLPFAIIGGIGIIASLYLFANLAFFYVLTPAAVAGVPVSSSVATEVVASFLGPPDGERETKRPGHAKGGRPSHAKSRDGLRQFLHAMEADGALVMWQPSLVDDQDVATVPVDGPAHNPKPSPNPGSDRGWVFDQGFPVDDEAEFPIHRLDQAGRVAERLPASRTPVLVHP